MPWYSFHFGRSSTSHGKSLARTVARVFSSDADTPEGSDALFTPHADQIGHMRWFFLFTDRFSNYLEIIRDLGGKICEPPSHTALQHLAGDWVVPGGESEQGIIKRRKRTRTRRRPD